MHRSGGKLQTLIFQIPIQRQRQRGCKGAWITLNHFCSVLDYSNWANNSSRSWWMSLYELSLKQSWYDNDYLMGRLNYWKPLKTTFVDRNVVRTRFEVVSGEHVRGLTSIKVDAKIIVHWMSLSLDGLEIKRGGWSITCLKIKSKYHRFKMRFNLGMEAKMTREMTDSHDHQVKNKWQASKPVESLETRSTFNENLRVFLN